MVLILFKYDLSTVIYSSNGKIYQLEYVSKLIKKSHLILGIINTDGILIIGENSSKITLGRFLDCKKIFSINKNSAIGCTGLFGDYKSLIEKIRSDDKNYQQMYSDFLNSRMISSRLSELVHMHTIYWHLRPFACSMIIGTISPFSFELFSIFHTGFSTKCLAVGIGRFSKIIKINLLQIIQNPKTCRRNLILITHSLIKIQKYFDLKSLEILCFSKEYKNFNKSLQYNIQTENIRFNKNFFDEEIKDNLQKNIENLFKF